MTVTQYECQACGWVYPPESDNTSDTVPSFSELEDGFSCPLCGVGKSEFRPIGQQQNEAASNTDLSKQTKQQIVIIGAGLAGWTVVDAIRALNKEVGITLIAADKGHRYHKPMLSAAFSQRKSAEDLIRFKAQEAADKAGIELLSNTTVLSIDAENRKIVLSEGEIGYDKLVMAIGAVPAIPPTIDANNVWHINDIDNFHNFEQALSSASAPQHIAVIGAGMVGTEIAEDLTKSGHKISLLDMNEAPLALMLPKIASNKIKEALIKQGINFMGNCRVEQVIALAEGGYRLTVSDCLGEGEQSLQVDHILVSTGLKVDETLPHSAGLNFDRQLGIAVEEATLQSSHSDIYAIGDCMSIDGVPCRYVAPLRAQASTIAEHLLAHLGQHSLPQDGPQPLSEDSLPQSYEHKAYVHKPPMIRLKNKSISVSATGRPTADESNAQWQVVSDMDTETGHEMVLQQIDADGEVVATATLKTVN